MKKKFLTIWLFTIVLLSTCNTSQDVQTLVKHWTGETVEMPMQSVWTVDAVDTITLKGGQKISIVNYIDSIGCIRCKSQLPAWKYFIDEIHNMFGEKVSVMIFMHPHRIVDAKYAIRRDSFPYPVCIDVNDDFNKLNHFPDDDRFHCFLLDENNRVVLIGNPVQNPKIKDLYIRTICERLGIENVSKTDDNPRVNLGTFSKDEPKTAQFIIKNPDADYLKIDSVYTSCECTAAAINKTEINKNESALLTVTYTPDGAGEFYREVYVKINGEDKPRVFAIEGKTE